MNNPDFLKELEVWRFLTTFISKEYVIKLKYSLNGNRKGKGKKLIDFNRLLYK